MFTGIIENLGRIRERNQKSLAVGVEKKFLAKLSLGASVSVNGACLTVAKIKKPDIFFADIMPETWKKTMLDGLKKNDEVNLELPMSASGSFDGHIVQGHVDGVAKLRDIKIEKDSRILTFASGADITKYLVEKGSVTINGISLTIITVGKNTFSVGIIPHTWTRTMLKNLKKGDAVNIEIDILAKYIRKFYGKN